MSSTTFLLLGVTYYIVTIVIIVIVLNKINNSESKKYLTKIQNLEREKNQILSGSIVTELNKVEKVINDELTKEMYEDWKQRFDKIKKEEIPKITDDLIEIQQLFDEKKYKNLNKLMAKVEFDIMYIKSKSDKLLEEIKSLTLSNDINRDKITKLKQDYRKIIADYNNNKNTYEYISAPIELQFENVDKLFSAFEVNIENNNYQETSHIASSLEDVIGNLKLIIEEAPSIILMGTKLVPKKMEEIEAEYNKLTKEGYPLDYLNIEYNIKESNKKIAEILEKIKILNIEDSTLILKTLMEYFDSLYKEFEKERTARKIFNDLSGAIISKTNKLSKINGDLRKRSNDYINNYNVDKEEINVIEVLKDELKSIRNDYNELVTAARNKTFSYSRLAKEMNVINSHLSKVEDTLNNTVTSIRSLKDDEKRGREQLEEIKQVLKRAKKQIKSYNLPIVPKEYFVELKESKEAIKEMMNELEKKPITIEILNIRVDTARDLTLKLYNTSKEIVKTAHMAEMSIVYGNRYRTSNKEVDSSLTKAEISFLQGNYKKSLEQSINAINKIEPNYYNTLRETFENK